MHVVFMFASSLYFRMSRHRKSDNYIRPPINFMLIFDLTQFNLRDHQFYSEWCSSSVVSEQNRELSRKQAD